jgi:hypothetical protein
MGINERIATLNYFCTLYQNLPSIKDIAADDRACKVSKYLNIPHWKIITPSDVMRDHSNVSLFLKSAGPSIISPLTLSNQLMGFIFRSIHDKSYNILSLNNLYFYSSYRTMCYVLNNNIPYGTPYLFSEGMFDSECLSQIYPLSFSYLTSGISDVLAQFLSMMTNNVIMLTDNDTAGNNGFDKSSSILSKYNVKCMRLAISTEFKDAGDLLDQVVSSGKPANQNLHIQLLSNSVDSLFSNYGIIRI